MLKFTALDVRSKDMELSKYKFEVYYKDEEINRDRVELMIGKGTPEPRAPTDQFWQMVSDENDWHNPGSAVFWKLKIGKYCIVTRLYDSNLRVRSNSLKAIIPLFEHLRIKI